MRTTTQYRHIELDESGMPFIRGTQFKAVVIFVDRIGSGWDAEEIQRQHPQLTLAQVHEALAYYYDHKVEMDRLIEDRDRQAEALIATLPPSPMRAKLQALKNERGIR